MKTNPVILVVDDDPNIRQVVQLYLAKEGFTVRTADRGDTALQQVRADPPDLILLDVMLPGLDGRQVLTQVRKSSGIPVIMLTARDDTLDKVIDLELGADDYITKPFDGKELAARVKAVLRRTRGPEDARDDTISFPALSVSLSRFEVIYEGKRLEMPPKELELLYFLASNKGNAFTREQLLQQVWGFDFAGDSSRTVDVHVKRLREKLRGCQAHGWEIATVWTIGYKFALLS